MELFARPRTDSRFLRRARQFYRLHLSIKFIERFARSSLGLFGRRPSPASGHSRITIAIRVQELRAESTPRRGPSPRSLTSIEARLPHFPRRLSPPADTDGRGRCVSQLHRVRSRTHIKFRIRAGARAQHHPFGPPRPRPGAPHASLFRARDFRIAITVITVTRARSGAVLVLWRESVRRRGVIGKGGYARRPRRAVRIVRRVERRRERVISHARVSPGDPVEWPRDPRYVIYTHTSYITDLGIAEIGASLRWV